MLVRASDPGQFQPLSGRQARFGLLLFTIDHFQMLAEVYGEEFIRHLGETMRRAIATLTAQIIGPGVYTKVEDISPGKFVLVFELADRHTSTLPDMALEFRFTLRRAIKKEIIQLTGQSVNIQAGFGQFAHDPAMTFERSFFNAFLEAEKTAAGRVDPTRLSLYRDFIATIERGDLFSVYQPIVDLASGEVAAWEALIRGPHGSLLQSPGNLFDLAEETGSVFALEKACREAAFKGLGELGQGRKLFLNIHPQTMVDPGFCPGETIHILKKYGLKPQNVVFEITERHAVKDFTLFHRTLTHYRSQGYQVAVDDVGAGYSGLWSLAEIRPEFIKVDMSLVRGIDSNPVKRALMETMVAFADRTSSRIIAEGIETGEELSSLVAMGVHLGQGFYLAEPGCPKPLPSPRALAVALRRHVPKGLRCLMPVSGIVHEAVTVDASAKVSDVREIFDADESVSGVVVTRDGRPVGQVMSRALLRVLSTKFGLALYDNRPVDKIMDADCLMAESDTAVEFVAKQAMERPAPYTYDDVIITRHGSLLGVVSVQKLLDTLAKVQVEMAMGANPLTGLPGNVAIEQALERAGAEGDNTAIIYADLDNFKVYNDSYGFKNGDTVILLLARILAWAVRKYGRPGDFVGHVGGDDFVLVSGRDNAERLCLGITRCFKRAIRYCYSQEDRANGCIKGKDRSGNENCFPLVSVSLAIVDIAGRCDLCLIGMRAAEVKKFAKSIPGNSFVRDRRGALGGSGGAGAPQCSE